jgi:phosphoglycerate dehydrogenase-like enzyme
MRVAVLDDYHRIAHTLADWASLGVEVAFFDEALRGEKLTQALAGFDALVLMRERTAFPRPVLEQLPDLKLVITTGMRNASLDVEYLKSQGVVVCGTGMPGYGGRGFGGDSSHKPGVPSTVEIAWALIFALYKRVTYEDRLMRTGVWQAGLPINLSGTTLGLAGLGRLGSAMVAPARAFGMDVLAWSENLTFEKAQEAGATYVTKEELLSRSDVLSIHLVLSERTRGLFGAKELAMMKPTAFIVNTSRGPIIDESALISALSDDYIAGAGLDVYDVEPLPPHSPLLMLSNTVLTPHLGYVSRDALEEMYVQAVEDIAAYQRGEPIRIVG